MNTDYDGALAKAKHNILYNMFSNIKVCYDGNEISFLPMCLYSSSVSTSKFSDPC